VLFPCEHWVEWVGKRWRRARTCAHIVELASPSARNAVEKTDRGGAWRLGRLRRRDGGRDYGLVSSGSEEDSSGEGDL
jgi:hypothetical protein